MKVNLLCCVAGCRNWIRIDKGSFSTAVRAGWRIPDTKPWDGYAECPTRHSPVIRTVTVGEVRDALRGLPRDTAVYLAPHSAMLTRARQARNRNL